MYILSYLFSLGYCRRIQMVRLLRIHFASPVDGLSIARIDPLLQQLGIVYMPTILI